MRSFNMISTDFEKIDEFNMDLIHKILDAFWDKACEIGTGSGFQIPDHLNECWKDFKEGMSPAQIFPRLVPVMMDGIHDEQPTELEIEEQTGEETYERDFERAITVTLFFTMFASYETTKSHFKKASESLMRLVAIINKIKIRKMLQKKEGATALLDEYKKFIEYENELCSWYVELIKGFVNQVEA